MPLNGGSLNLFQPDSLQGFSKEKLPAFTLPALLLFSVAAVWLSHLVGRGFTAVCLSLAVQRPVIHPLSSPSNMFCVTSLDPDTLPTVATLLMDVMFYSNG